MEKVIKQIGIYFMIVSKLDNATKYFALKSDDKIFCLLNFYKVKTIIDLLGH